MYQTILLAYNGTREGRLALREGAEIAKACRTATHLLAVVSATSVVSLGEGFDTGHLVSEEVARYQEILDEGVALLRGHGLTAEGHLAQGEPSERIAAMARALKADLIVVGHRNRSRFARWWQGTSLSASLLEQSPCSILVTIAGEDIARAPDAPAAS
ncbi:MAG: hypothetical protein B7Z66_03425 [Chromatiales bacterium 21-64-14]|nr:MAG: hypothetical protein B7Z66_03425 [Chromatiales bacterium 21-64-14]HQU15810.1 universal stress protein [Gammaproteobacteria bacterium]